MKILWNISWSKYSWEEIRLIYRAYKLMTSDYIIPPPLINNILYIAVESHDVYLLKKVVATEKDIDVNEQDANGWTVLHLASYFFLLNMVRFLVEDQGADYKITTNKGESPIYLAANNRDVCMTEYYLELGEEMPKIQPESRDNADIAKFFKLLCREFRGEAAQLAKLHNEQKKYIVGLLRDERVAGIIKK
ncbi:MAG: ankyrin repeat domain-containing protein [Rickettsia endosymbiont of Pentastiridius leporinus]